MKSFIILLTLIPSLAVAQDVTGSFSNLKSLSVDHTPVGSITIYYDPKITTILNTLDKKLFEEDGIKEIDAIRTKLSPSHKNEYIVKYSSGASVDPGFSIYQAGSDPSKPIWGKNGTEIIIPGNGNIYVAGHTNNMFDQRIKFTFRKGRIEEVSQPYYYVGLETTTNKPLTLYETPEPTPSGHAVVARLPKGSGVTVVVNKENYYLLKTPFGLVGWVRIGYEPIGTESTIDGLIYAGD